MLLVESEQQAGIVRGGALGIAIVTLLQVLVPQLTGALAELPELPPAPAELTLPPAPAELTLPPAVPLPPALPPIVVGSVSEVLPQAGTTTTTSRAPTKRTRMARNNMDRKSFTRRR